MCMAPPPEFNYDLTAEILLRVAPDKPARLFRASLVCKLWCRILSDPGFLRRYVTFHQCPTPLLGFFYNLDFPGPFSSFVATTATGAGSPLPTAASSLLPGFDDCRVPWALDCRHGRVLFKKKTGGLAVWDPIADVWTDLPPPGIQYESYAAVVLCDVAGCRHHRDCRGAGRFRVVCIGRDADCTTVYACVYSSEDRAWQAPVSDGTRCWRFDVKRPALVGDGIYCIVGACRWILRYSLVQRRFSRIHMPCLYRRDPVLMQHKDGSLGFAGVRGSTLYIWSRRWTNAGGWEQCRFIRLRELLPVDDEPYILKANVIGFAEGVGVFFLTTVAGVFTLELQSGRMMKVSKPSNNYRTAFPFISFSTPEGNF